MLDVYIDIEASLAAVRSSQGCILFGVPAMKGVEDLQRYRRIVESTQPDLIIQTGTAVGGSALWFAHNWFLYDGPDVVTIDIDGSRVHQVVLDDPKITVVVGDSTDRTAIFLAEVFTSSTHYSKVMVVLDSDHSGEHVQREIELYSPLVSPGCYLMVEDGIYDFMSDSPFDPGPMWAIENYLVGNDEWERDTEIEAMEKVSMYPVGWWIKKST